METPSTLPGPNPFPPTHWDLVEAAVDPHETDRALDGLLRVYLPFLEAHIMKQFSLPPEQAQDYLQAFVLEKIIQKELLRNACAERGKFRNFLTRSLHNFIIQQMRREGTTKRTPSNSAIPIHEVPESSFAEVRSDHLDGFDIAWARGILSETLRRMRLECLSADRTDLWTVFEGRLLRPLIQGSPPVSYGDLIRQFGFGSIFQASNILITAKRMFARNLHAVVAGYVQNEAQIESEINDLKSILSRSGAESDPATRNSLWSTPAQQRA